MTAVATGMCRGNVPALSSRASATATADADPVLARVHAQFLEPFGVALQQLVLLAERGCRRSQTVRRSCGCSKRGRKFAERTGEDVGDEDVGRRSASAAAAAKSCGRNSFSRSATPLRSALSAEAMSACGSLSTPTALAAPSFSAAMARMPEPQPKSVSVWPGRSRLSSHSRHSAVVGWVPLPNARPGSSRTTTMRSSSCWAARCSTDRSTAADRTASA